VAASDDTVTLFFQDPNGEVRISRIIKGILTSYFIIVGLLSDSRLFSLGVDQLPQGASLLQDFIQKLFLALFSFSFLYSSKGWVGRSTFYWVRACYYRVSVKVGDNLPFFFQLRAPSR